MTNPAPVGLFYSYAHEDESLRDELAGHLKILERRGLISVWHDRKIVPGQDWTTAIDDALNRAELVLLLVSKDFIGSDYIFGVELKRAMQRQEEQACDVVPIIVRAVDIDPDDAEALPFMKLQALPTDLKPVTSWGNRDEAWTHVAKGLRATVKAIRVRRPLAAFSTPNAPAPSLFRTAPVADLLLDGVVNGVMAQFDEAEMQRRGHPVLDHARQELNHGARALIDLPKQKRVLWVDDRPEGNLHEAAALAKLQIEVVGVRSTDEALSRIASDARAGEEFDLVLSDWDRPEEGPDATGLLPRRIRSGSPRRARRARHRRGCARRSSATFRTAAASPASTRHLKIDVTTGCATLRRWGVILIVCDQQGGARGVAYSILITPASRSV
ncbi:MAG: toll/interleukin-1 receptor domain-containing protein [Betaproteobacteria bacterium]